MKCRSIIFDFDGVICESIPAKTEAFQKLFEDYPEHLDKIIKIHMDNGGMSRYRKFEIIFRDILKKDLKEEESARLGQKFSEYCYDAVIKCPYVKGAYEFLEKYYQKYLLFVVSGTPEEEMDAVIAERNLGKFFKGIYGSPRLKHELCNLILEENNLNTQEVVFVGDSINDWEGAQKAGIRFIGRIHEAYPNPFEHVSADHLIKDLSGLDDFINICTTRIKGAV